MSLTATRESKHAQGLCQSCAERKARFRYNGAVKADRDHTLCFECYRAESDRRRARRLADIPPATRSLAPARIAFSEQQVAHRRAMLRHLQVAR